MQDSEILRLIADTRRANPSLPDRTGVGGQARLSVLLVARRAMKGYSDSGGKDAMRRVERDHPELFAKALRGEYEAPPEPTGPVIVEPVETPRTLESDVQLHRAQERAQEATGRLREAHARIAALEDRLRDFECVGGSTALPAEWTLKPSCYEREHIPYLFTSDFQIGEVIRPEETDSAHGYDAPTFQLRYRRLIELTVDLALNHQSGWNYPGMIYARGGDTISGGIHEELLETDELTPIEAVELAFEEEAAGILKLAEAFGKVEVKSTGGNHDRDTRKPQSKRANAHSYDRLVGYMLRREFRNDPRVSFQTSESPDVYFPVYSTRILLTHGDKIGSRGGQGFIGPAATIMRGAQKVIMEQMALGRPVDEVHVGHFHTPLELGYAIANGCLPGYSEYAKLLRCRPEAPSQWLMFYSAKHGRVDMKKLYLEEPKPSGVSWMSEAA